MSTIGFNLRTSSAVAIAFAACAMPDIAHANITIENGIVTVDAPDENGGGQADQAEPAKDVNYSSGLTEIVVTATKRETNLQKTPISISVLAPEAMKDRHVQSLIDLADGAVPSLRVATFEARQSALTVGIRGIVPFDANQTARDQGVGVYIDGVYLGRQQGLNMALLDVQRIEVLRGPQGTLFGRNTEGGAVSLVTRKPTGEFGGRMVGGVGNYGSYNGEVHLNLPEIANFSIKLDGLAQHQDATISNPLQGQTGWNYKNNVGGRVTTLWEPIDGLSMEMSYDKARGESTPFFSQLVNYNPNKLPVGTYAGTKLICPTGVTTCIAPLSPLVIVGGYERQSAATVGVPQQPSVDRTRGFANTIKYKATPGLELRSITSWRSVATEQWDNSGGPQRTVFQPNANFSRYSLSYLTQTQFSQELQAVGSVDSIDYVGGLYYFTENVREFAATPSTNKWNADGTAYTINDPQTWAIKNWAKQRDSNAKARSYAVFAQATWNAMDVFHVTAGGRYTKDKRNGALTMVQNKPANFPFTFDKGRFDPMVTVAFDAADGVNLFAKYATGYRAGGANSRSQTFASFDAEHVKSYEIGAKMDLLDRRLRLNLAGYMMDRKGTQIDFDNVDINPNSPTFNLHTQETGNAPGTSKLKGIEVEMTAKPFENLTMGASYAYTDAQVPLTPNPFLTNALTQVFVVFTPKNAASAYADLDIPVNDMGTKIRLHLDANYADAVYSFQDENVLTEPSFIVNGRLSIADMVVGNNGQKFTLSAWSRNLLNEAHIYRRSNSNDSKLGSYANFNAPRTFGLEVTMNF